MFKKNMIIVTVILIIIVSYGQIIKSSFVDLGLMTINDISNLDSMKFKIFRLLNDQDMELLKEYKNHHITEAGKTCEYIAVVKPTGGIKFHIFGSIQEVYVMI